MTAVNRVAESEDHPCKGGAVHRSVKHKMRIVRAAVIFAQL